MLRKLLILGVLSLYPCFAERVCPVCGHTVADGWKYCPIDGATLVLDCPKCKKPMQEDWLFCPYDATPLKGSTSMLADEGGNEEPAQAPGARSSEDATDGSSALARLDNTAPDKAVKQWFQLAGAGDREELELLYASDFFTGGEGESLPQEKLLLEKERYFKKLLKPENRVIFKTGYIEYKELKLNRDKAEFNLQLVRPDKPFDPIAYIFRLRMIEDRWYISQII